MSTESCSEEKKRVGAAEVVCDRASRAEGNCVKRGELEMSE